MERKEQRLLKSIAVFEQELNGNVREDMTLVNGVITYHTLSFFSDYYNHGRKDDALVAIVDIHNQRITFPYSYTFNSTIRLVEIMGMVIDELGWSHPIN